MPGGVVTNWVRIFVFFIMIMLDVAIKRPVGFLIKSVVLNWANGDVRDACSKCELCWRPRCRRSKAVRDILWFTIRWITTWVINVFNSLQQYTGMY